MNSVIVGIDEAGRGAIAGPVVAGACVEVPELKNNPIIKDSKKLSPEQREVAYAWITQNCVYGYGVVPAEVVDKIGILAATEKAMQQAVGMIEDTLTPTYLLIDGRDKFWFDYPHSSIIGGDDSEPSIAAGSIVAKVTRDKMMIAYHQEFPHYNFDKHKGYGSAVHYEAIQDHGLCPLHRHTFIHLANATTK